MNLLKKISIISLSLFLLACDKNHEVKQINQAFIKGISLPSGSEYSYLISNDSNSKSLTIDLKDVDFEDCKSTLTFQLNKNNQVFWSEISVQNSKSLNDKSNLYQKDFELYTISNYCSGYNNISLTADLNSEEIKRNKYIYSNYQSELEEASFIHELHNTYYDTGQVHVREQNIGGREITRKYLSELQTPENSKELNLTYYSASKNLCKLIMSSNVINSNISHLNVMLNGGYSRWTEITLNEELLEIGYKYNTNNICHEDNKITLRMELDN